MISTLRLNAAGWPAELDLVCRWYAPHLERKYEDAAMREADLGQLAQIASGYPSRERFLTELTLDPPNATSDLAGTPLLDEDYLTLTTIHSAKGMEWDTVYLLNVVDGSFPSEFATGKAELIEEERRLFYVALTRAQNDLILVAPLKFHLTGQSRHGDAHVYGGRSRFLNERVLKTLDATTFQGSSLGVPDISLQPNAESTLDITARMKEMW